MIEDTTALEKGDSLTLWTTGRLPPFIIINMVSGMEGLIEGGRIAMPVSFSAETADSLPVGG